MRVGIFATHYTWPIHFETDLEIAQGHIDQGDEVFFHRCHRVLNCCELIWHRSVLRETSLTDERRFVCSTCVKKQAAGMALINGRYTARALLHPAEVNALYPLDSHHLQDQASLKQLAYDGHYDVGWGILSTLISMHRDPFIALEAHRPLLRELYQDCVRVYNSVKRFIAEDRLDCVYVFNGRFSYTKAVMCAARAMRVTCFVHERGADLSRYSVFTNHTIHNIGRMTDEIRRLWEEEPDQERKAALGRSFYEDRQNNINGNWISFLDAQDRTLLPESWDRSKRNIVLFTSSEDEFSGISHEWESPLFSTQHQGISVVAEFVSRMPEAQLYVRIHPNVKTMSASYRTSLMELARFPNVTLLNYDSPVSSYQLLHHAACVVVYCSTIGMEGVFWRKPVIQLGKALYSELQGPIRPTSIAELGTLLADRTLEPPAEDEALKFGFFLKTYGIPYRHYQPAGVFRGTFKGKDLNKYDSYIDEPTLFSRVYRVARSVKLALWSAGATKADSRAS